MKNRKRFHALAAAVLTMLFSNVAFAATESTSNATEQIVKLYLPMHDAFAGDSMQSVKEQAAKITTEAAAAAQAGGADQAAMSSIAEAAKGMTANDIQELREQFRPLSMAVAKLVEVQPVGGHGIYYCPMADAYWIQKSGDVANPYYGKMMLRCGDEVKKVDG